jgi:phospholipid/cholesterol/gamma-HCH transport system substrate-binding protein
MLTRTARAKVIVFAVLAVLVIAYTGLHYAKIGRLVGAPGYYVVAVDMPQAGGIFPDADVTYRGVSVGRVGSVRLDGSGIQVQLDISNSAPRIPADTQAVVANLSAVGETYLDLRPRVTSGPSLTAHSVISTANTQVPPPVTDLLSAADSLARSLPGPQLRTLVNELYYAFNGQGSNLQLLLASASKFTKAAAANLSQSTGLIQSSSTVLATQQAETTQIENFATDIDLFASQLASSNSALRQLISAAPPAATQVVGLLKDNTPDLGLTLAHLLTAANVALPRHANLEELLTALPAAVAAGNTAITSNGANFGLALTFFDPLPCTSGYQSTTYRPGTDTAAPRTSFNTKAQCTEPATQGNVRGAQHAP